MATGQHRIYSNIGTHMTNKMSGRATAVKKNCSKKVKVPGREDPYGCETLRLPHYLDNRLTDGGNVVSFTRRQLFTPQKNYLINSW
jgi:hypothetical protein